MALTPQAFADQHADRDAFMVNVHEPAGATIAGTDAAIVRRLHEAVLDQRNERSKRLRRIWPLGFDEDAAAGAGCQHHQPHDRRPAHAVAVFGDFDRGAELTG